MRRKPGPKPGHTTGVAYAPRCPKCGKRYVNIEAHTGKCTGPKP